MRINFVDSNNAHYDHTSPPPDPGVRRGRVLVVGLGGLGAPAALHLAAAGVGTIGLMDGDVVELSNLPRQVIYRDADIGQPKVDAAARYLAALRPDVQVRAFPMRLTTANLPALFHDFDFVIDGTDGVMAKYLINDGAVLHAMPFSHAGVIGLQGQTMTVLPGRSACLRCLFPIPPAEGQLPVCQAAGVLGPVAGCIALLQAAEAVKFLRGEGTLLVDRLLIYDAGMPRWRTVALSRQPTCPICGDQPTLRTLDPPAGAPCPSVRP